MSEVGTPPDYAKVSLSFEEIRQLKSKLQRPYAERMSFALIVRLAQLRLVRNEHFLVIAEIDYLEGLTRASQTKAASQFKHAPLHPFWHKHYSAPRHILKNIGDHWGLPRGGNRKLSITLEKIADKHGSDQRWQSQLSHTLVMQGYENRAVDGLTGDWIIYAKHNGLNYYLDLATHEEGCDGDRLYQKLQRGSQAEFPFAFEQGGQK